MRMAHKVLLSAGLLAGAAATLGLVAREAVLSVDRALCPTSGWPSH